jgi:hypothetical protein
MMSQLQNKSVILSDAATLLHDKCWYPAVAHGAYYSCYQLSKHIWLYRMGKTQNELDAMCSTSKQGSHEVLINEIGKHIEASGKKDCANHRRDFKNKILQLKKLRVQADYDDANFDSLLSKNAIYLSSEILPILKQYQ